MQTFLPLLAKHTAKLVVMVVFPTPPLRFVTDITINVFSFLQIYSLSCACTYIYVLFLKKQQNIDLYITIQKLINFLYRYV